MAHVKVFTLRSSRQAHDVRLDAEVLVPPVEQYDVVVADRAALAGVVAHCMAEPQLRASLVQRHKRAFVIGAPAALWAHAQLQVGVGDAAQDANESLDREMWPGAGGAPNVLQAHPYEHVMWLHLGATEVFFALPRAEQSALRLQTSVLHVQGKPLEGLWATQHPSESDQIDVQVSISGGY